MKFTKKVKSIVLSGSIAVIICTLSALNSFAQERQGTTPQGQTGTGQQEQPGTTPQEQPGTPPQEQPGAVPQEQPGTPPQQVPQTQPVKEDFSDETLEKFVDINIKLAPHQQEGETQMVKAIEDEGLQTDRFNEIMTARQMNDSSSAGASEEEIQKVEAATQKIMGIQQELQQKMSKVITDEGMQLQEFQEIAIAYQQSPKVQQKVNELVQKEQAASGQADSTEAAPVEE